MMTLFSSFDIFIFYFSHLSYWIISFILLLNFWKNNSLKSFKISIFTSMASFFKSIMSFKFKFLDFFLLSLMFFLIFINIFSILSYFFSLTSQISFNFYWGFSSWVSLMSFSLFYNFKHCLIHFIPEGTPLFLIWFLFFVEIVSTMIRPITLVVRLLANILAGHLLMILLSKMVFMLQFFMFFYIFLNIVELFVALIQSYIFVTMLILYFSEM